MLREVWECPKCLFAFDAMHIDQDGGYTCPVCEVDELKKEYQKIEKQLFDRHVELHSTYAWVDPQTAIDLMSAEIKTLKAELAEARQELENIRKPIGFSYITVGEQEEKPAFLRKIMD